MTGGVEVTVSAVSLIPGPGPPMVAVEMAGRIIVATQLAVLQVRHLPDEVDGDVGTLTVHRLAPRPGAAGPGAGVQHGAARPAPHLPHPRLAPAQGQSRQLTFASFITYRLLD